MGIQMFLGLVFQKHLCSFFEGEMFIFWGGCFCINVQLFNVTVFALSLWRTLWKCFGMYVFIYIYMIFLGTFFLHTHLCLVPFQMYSVVEIFRSWIIFCNISAKSWRLCSTLSTNFVFFYILGYDLVCKFFRNCAFLLLANLELLPRIS